MIVIIVCLCFCEGLVDEEGQPRKLVTIEPEDRFCICFAQFVDSFNQHTEQLKASKSKRENSLHMKCSTESYCHDELVGLAMMMAMMVLD